MAREMHYLNRWAVGQWQFLEIDGTQLHESYKGRTLFGFETQAEDGARPEVSNVREWFNSLEHAMAAAIAEKYTGPRGAGGTGVGTAADWFMRMIGADTLVDAGAEGRTALAEIVRENVDSPLVAPRTVLRKVERALDGRGLVLARQNPR
jgi:hypothetical protein